jgi:hypothetical protein
VVRIVRHCGAHIDHQHVLDVEQLHGAGQLLHQRPEQLTQPAARQRRVGEPLPHRTQQLQPGGVGVSAQVRLREVRDRRLCVAEQRGLLDRDRGMVAESGQQSQLASLER